MSDVRMTTAPRGPATPRRRRRVLQPRAVVTIALAWVLLWDRVTWGNVVNGVLIGLLVTYAFPLPSIEFQGRLRPHRLLLLIGHFLVDLVASSWQVMRLAFGRRRPRNAVIEVQLRSRSPERMYEEPETVFVADFLGVSNLMPVTVEGADSGACRVKHGEFSLRASRGELDRRGETHVVIRPERVSIEPYEATGENRVPGMIDRVVYHGASEQLVIRLATGDVVQALVVRDGSVHEWSQGTAVQVHLPADALRVLPPSSAAETAVAVAPEAVPEDGAAAVEVSTS